MTQQSNTEQMVDAQQRRGRGPTKPYPLVPFEETAQLARGIMEHGVSGEIERLTLLDRLDLSRNSSKTRGLITHSSKYGLTVGGYNASILKITEEASHALSPDTPAQEGKLKEFELAIGRFDQFLAVYERIKEGRLRDEAVLRGEMGRVGVMEPDRQRAAEVFIANLRYVGLVENISGSEQVRSIEEIASSLSSAESDERPLEESSSTSPFPAVSSSQTSAGSLPAMPEPAVHIDIQIHIDSSATSEQIDQIFASMARHLYGRNG